MLASHIAWRYSHRCVANRRSEYQFNQLPDGGKMKEDQYEVAKLQQELTRIDNIGYELHCQQEKAIEALNQIINVPYTAASDSRAVKEMVRIAEEALSLLLKIAEPST